MNDTEKLKLAREALEDIINPIEAMRRAVPEGYRFEGGMALHMAKDSEWYKRRAREAIDAIDAPAAPPVAESVLASIDTPEWRKATYAYAYAIMHGSVPDSSNAWGNLVDATNAWGAQQREAGRQEGALVSLQNYDAACQEYRDQIAELRERADKADAALAEQMALFKKAGDTDQAEFNRKWTEQKDRADRAEAALAATQNILSTMPEGEVFSRVEAAYGGPAPDGELPPLPEPLIHDAAGYRRAFDADQMRDYGRACMALLQPADAALRKSMTELRELHISTLRTPTHFNAYTDIIDKALATPAAPVSQPAAQEATQQDQLIELAAALEQQWLAKVLGELRAMQFREGPFLAGFETALDEIEARCGVKAWDAAQAEQAAPQPITAPEPAARAVGGVEGMEDPIMVPRGLIGAACYLIRKHAPDSKLLEKLRAFTLAAAPAAPAVDPTHTCIGKGGAYIRVGEAKAAGALSGYPHVVVYQDAADGALYFRLLDDFAARMAPVVQKEGGAA